MPQHTTSLKNPLYNIKAQQSRHDKCLQYHYIQIMSLMDSVCVDETL